MDFARWIHLRSPFRSFLTQFIAWRPLLSLGADGLLVPSSGRGLLCGFTQCPECVRCASLPTAGLARRRTRLTRAAFAGRHFIYFYLGPKAILIFKSG